MKHIIINNQKLVNITKIGKNNIYTLEDNSQIKKNDFKIIQTECPVCKKNRTIKKLYFFNLKKASECHKCKSVGCKNGFFNKKHTGKTKKIISKKNKNKLVGSKNPMYGISLFKYWKTKYGTIIADNKYKEYLNNLSYSLRGEKNPFYGKKHTKKTLKIIKDKNETYRNNLSIEEKEIINKKISESQKKIYNKDPKKYIEQRSKAGKITANKSNRYKINKIEQLVLDQLIKLNLKFSYSVILDYKQFDFGSTKYKILLEVQGDYWHGNPNIYKKTQLNYTQKKIIAKDKQKVVFANKHNIKLYHIWESDIKNNNFSILEDIKNEIYTRTHKKN